MSQLATGRRRSAWELSEGGRCGGGTGLSNNGVAKRIGSLLFEGGKEGTDAATLDAPSLDGHASDDGQTESETDVDKDEQEDDEALGAVADGAPA